MNPRYRNIAIGLALLAVVGGFLVFRDGSSETYSGNDDASAKLKDNEIQVTGVIACLPYNAGVSATDCVKSIRGDDGKVYALNTIKINGAERNYAEGQKVLAIGVYEPANTSVDDASVFKYDGVLVVRSLKKI